MLLPTLASPPPASFDVSPSATSCLLHHVIRHLFDGWKGGKGRDYRVLQCLLGRGKNLSNRDTSLRRS
ncbi:hypothetical protein L2E82_11081 [Cichorium intybus]|uniref:Uncharacterized protein n=1 Tax=Cichorium intybus TaxID=13427 RepID=A0ACB9GCG5_CICIN|nr:hypothetical protein L2E82_11081 [Cichorium intybus]